MYIMKSEQLSFETEFLLDHITSKLWKELQDSEVAVTDQHREHKDFIVRKLQKLMEDNEEKWRDREGKEFYQRVRDFIEKLKEN